MIVSSLYQSKVMLRKSNLALAGVAQWIEHLPANQRVSGSIPIQRVSSSITPALWAISPVGGVQEATTH